MVVLSPCTCVVELELLYTAIVIIYFVMDEFTLLVGIKFQNLKIM